MSYKYVVRSKQLDNLPPDGKILLLSVAYFSCTAQPRLLFIVTAKLALDAQRIAARLTAVIKVNCTHNQSGILEEEQEESFLDHRQKENVKKTHLLIFLTMHELFGLLFIKKSRKVRI